jgi:TolA-binding protein
MRRLMLLGLLLASTSPVLAQDTRALESRVSTVEKELRAVQRKVFPGANPRYFDAEIAPPEAAPETVGTPSASPTAELAARVDALEKELARVTAQSEENGFKLRQLEADLARTKADTGSRLSALESGAPVAPPTGAATAPSQDSPFAAQTPKAAPPKPAPTKTPPAAPVVVDATPTTTSSAATPPPPAGDAPSGDPAEDAYLAGYRLWEAKRFGEAETALADVVKKYPNHRRASYAQNLLGRSYLDEGKPAQAAEAFYANYQKMPRGERAPDSLYFLGQSLTQLKKPAEACKVYAELTDVYGEKLAEPLKSRLATAKAQAKCS